MYIHVHTCLVHTHTPAKQFLEEHQREGKVHYDIVVDGQSTHHSYEAEVSGLLKHHQLGNTVMVEDGEQ